MFFLAKIPPILKVEVGIISAKKRFFGCILGPKKRVEKNAFRSLWFCQGLFCLRNVPAKAEEEHTFLDFWYNFVLMTALRTTNPGSKRVRLDYFTAPFSDHGN